MAAWVTVYWVGGQEKWRDEEQAPPLAIGEGVIPEGGQRRYRVRDIWSSYDQHGAFDYARNVILEDVTNTEDDVPQRTRPDYYTT